jgi:hypothetical protein
MMAENIRLTLNKRMGKSLQNLYYLIPQMIPQPIQRKSTELQVINLISEK